MLQRSTSTASSRTISFHAEVCGFLAAAIFSLSGCGSFMGLKKDEPVDGIDTRAMRAAGYTFDELGAQKPIPASDDKPSVVLEVRNGKRHLERIPMPPDKPLFIQDVVHDAKLQEKLGKIDITILRPTTGNHPPIRLKADVASGNNGVVNWQNYALQPGDQIIVAKDSTSWVDNMMSNVMPLRNK